MKVKTVLAVLLCMALVSCSRESETEDVPKETVFTYKANGVQVEFKNPHINDTRIAVVNSSSPSGAAHTHYILRGLDERYENEVSFIIGPAAAGNWLAETTYAYAYPAILFSGVKYRGVQYAGLTEGDHYRITITKIHNGYADGTFSGGFTNTTNPNEFLSITDGTFKDLKVW